MDNRATHPFTAFATGLFEPGEARLLAGHRGNVPANLDRNRMEAASGNAGLVAEHVEVIGRLLGKLQPVVYVLAKEPR